MVRTKSKDKAVSDFKRIDSLYSRISVHLQNARQNIARSVNTEMVKTYWLIGREIVEEEQRGQQRAEYGAFLLEEISNRLTSDIGKGFGKSTLKDMRQFYLTYQNATLSEKSHALRGQLQISKLGSDSSGKSHTACGQLATPALSPDLSWTHYRELMRVSRFEARGFYEVEAVKNNWSSRELRRQIDSLLFDRLSKSKDKAGVLELARKGQEINKPEDAIKEPFVLEFLGLPESYKLVESKLEAALTDNLQHFLLELGKGFAFVARQKRLTLDGDHFYADLVFYHTTLKCYVVIDIKTHSLTHADLGQMQLYVNYFDLEIKKMDDNPTIGLVLCTNKNEAMVKYTLGEKAKQVFASKYQLHLPTEAELEAELKREVKAIKTAVLENQ